MIKSMITSNLYKAAGVFDLIIPDDVSDDTQVGSIRNTPVFAGEIRRLSKALEEHREWLRINSPTS